LAQAVLVALGQVKEVALLAVVEPILSLAPLLQQVAAVVVLVQLERKKMVWQVGQVVALDLEVVQVELLVQAIRHPLRRHKAIVAAQRKTVHIEAALEAAAHQQQEQTHQVRAARLAVTALHQAFLEHQLHMLAAAAVVLIPAPTPLAEQAGQAVAEQVDIQALALLAQQTQVAVAVAENLVGLATQAAPVLLSFPTPEHNYLAAAMSLLWVATLSIHLRHQVLCLKYNFLKEFQ
jgi:hypothetical protein